MPSMKMNKKEKMTMPEKAVSYESPEYPYGLKLHLDNMVIERLGIEKIPDVESAMEVKAMAYVCYTSESSDEEMGENRAMSLQITDLEIKPVSKRKPEDVLYKNDND